jgi:hypothetical protein
MKISTRSITSSPERYDVELRGFAPIGIMEYRNDGTTGVGNWHNGIVMKTNQSMNFKFITSFYTNIPVFHHSIFPPT